MDVHKKAKMNKKLLNKSMVQLQDRKHRESYATVPHCTTVSNPLTPRLISYDKIFTQLLTLWMKSFGVTIQLKTLRQNFYVVRFISTDFTTRNLNLFEPL